MNRLGGFISSFGSQFENVNRLTLDSIASYTHGLLSETRRKNIERIAEDKLASNYQNIRCAVSEAQWDHRQVMDGIAQQASLIIDEFGVCKKGDMSVGVQRPWNGRMGKTDNCQVAVLGAVYSSNAARAIH